MFYRPIFQQLEKRVSELRQFIHVLAGPRQVGKTTLARQLMESLPFASHFASADALAAEDRQWIQQQWEIARLKLADSKSDEGLLVLDEVQKVPGWSEVVKAQWDADSINQLPLKVIILGSSPLLVQRGLSESLAGRFEITPIRHWSFSEMRDAFDMSLDEYIYFGGYPGAAALSDDESRWQSYILDSLIETTISRDILLMTQVNKPALLRQLFYLGCNYSGQILSYQKMVGQMQDAGNTTTLAHYLELLAGAGMLGGISKYAGQKVRQRGSSPKFQVMNMALMSALANQRFEQLRADPESWGRWVESAVGAHLINTSLEHGFELFYWRERGHEVDFIVRYQGRLLAIEVKSHKRQSALPGMDAFVKAFRPDKVLLVGGDGLDVELFLSMDVKQWLP
ncbi:MAG: ATP-binding protein [Mariprofundaceae bacterium]